MSSNLRVDRILPSIGTEVGIGTATGSVALYGDVNVAGTLTYEDITNIDSVGVITARSGLEVTGGSVGIGTDNPQVQLHLTAADPYIRFQDTAAPTGHSQIMGTHQGALVLSADTSNSVADSHLRFDVDGDEKLRITSAGNLGVGLLVPNQKLHLHAAGSGGNKIKFTNDTTATGASDGFTVGIDGSENAELRLDEATNMLFVTNSTERLRITSDGKIVTSGGAAVGTVTLAGDGKDMVFGRTQNSGTGGVGRLVATGNIVYLQAGANASSGSAADIVFGNYGGVGERLRITSDGKIGINNSAPLYPMHFKNAMASTPSYIYMEVTGTNTVGGGGGIVFDTSASNTDTGLYLATIKGLRNSADNGSNDLVFSTSASGVAGDDGNTHSPKEKLRITSGGDVTIGNSSVAFPSGGGLQVYNASAPRIKLTNSTTGVASGDGLQIYVSGSSAIFDQKENAEMRFYTNATEKLRITSAGLVGVGVASPSLSYGNGIHIAGGNAGLKLQNTNNGDWAYVEYADESNTTKFIQGYRDSSGVYSIRPGTTLNATSGISLTSDGLMGLGTNNPSSYVGGGENLVIADSSGAGITIASGTSNSGTINFADGASGDARYRGRVEYSHSLDALDILTAATTQIRIDNSGRVLLGTLNSTGTQLLKINGDTSATTNGGHIALTQGRTSPGNGATHGVLSFGTETRPEVVKVVSFVDGTWTDGQYHPSGLYIATTDYNRNSPTEKIRITDIGEVNCYSTGSVIQAGTLQGGGYNAYFYEGRRNQNTGGTRTYIVWSNGNVQNTNNSYGSLSDQRLKENIVDATSQWDDIKSLQIRKYNFREATGNETHTQIGLIAQEAESVSPGLVQTTAVSEGEVLQDADGNQIESVKSINYSVLYMKAVKALQEAQTRIEALEARVTTLEG